MPPSRGSYDPGRHASEIQDVGVERKTKPRSVSALVELREHAGGPMSPHLQISIVFLNTTSTMSPIIDIVSVKKMPK